MKWDGKSVLVTGAGGFIGSHLCEALVKEGARVRALVHYNALGGHGWLDESEIRQDLEIVAGDLCDRDSVRQVVAGCDIVFHLGALIAIPYSYTAPESYVRVNVLGTLNVLQAAREYGLERVIHTSTSEVYGTAMQVPIDEQHPLQGQSPYSASKIAADKMVEAFCRSYSLPVVTVRPFNTFGPRQSARAVIPTIITQCLTGETVTIGATHPTRDLNYVSNTVEGFIRAASVENVIGEVVNLGTGREISIGDLALLIGRILGRELPVAKDKQRLRPHASEVERLLACNQKAKRLLDWSPRIDLETGLEKTIEWFQSNLERYRPGVYTV